VNKREIMDIAIRKLDKFAGFEPDYRLELGGIIMRISQTEANDLLKKLQAVTTTRPRKGDPEG